MAIFNSYVKLPEGNRSILVFRTEPREKWWQLADFSLEVRTTTLPLCDFQVTKQNLDKQGTQYAWAQL